MPPIRVVSYNVRGLRDDRAALIDVIRDLRPDILCLQEAPRRLAWRGKLAAFARDTELLYVAGGGSSGGTAVLTSVRTDVKSAAEHLLPRTWGLTRRGFVVSRLAIGGHDLVIAAIHLGLDPAERARHATAILGQIRLEVASASAIVGDVNETEASATWARLASSYVDAGADDPTPTFSTANPRHRIDGVFVGGTVAVENYQVIDTPQVVAASDHRPVVVDLTLTD